MRLGVESDAHRDLEFDAHPEDFEVCPAFYGIEPRGGSFDAQCESCVPLRLLSCPLCRRPFDVSGDRSIMRTKCCGEAYCKECLRRMNEVLGRCYTPRCRKEWNRSMGRQRGDGQQTITSSSSSSVQGEEHAEDRLAVKSEPHPLRHFIRMWRDKEEENKRGPETTTGAELQKEEGAGGPELRKKLAGFSPQRCRCRDTMSSKDVLVLNHGIDSDRGACCWSWSFRVADIGNFRKTATRWGDQRVIEEVDRTGEASDSQILVIVYMSGPEVSIVEKGLWRDNRTGEDRERPFWLLIPARKDTQQVAVRDLKEALTEKFKGAEPLAQIWFENAEFWCEPQTRRSARTSRTRVSSSSDSPSPQQHRESESGDGSGSEPSRLEDTDVQQERFLQRTDHIINVASFVTRALSAPSIPQDEGVSVV